METLQNNTQKDHLASIQEDIGQAIGKPVIQKIFEAYDLISQYMRDYLRKEGFLEFKPPLIGPVTDPGIRGAKQVEIGFYGTTYKFMSSAILYKQLLSISRQMAGKDGKIFFFADNLRLEPIETASTDRHLVEFVQVDLEIVDADHFVAMDVAEGLVTYLHQTMAQHEELLQPIWKHFGDKGEERGLIPFKEVPKIKGKFKRYTHADIVELLQTKLDENPEIVQKIREVFGIKPKNIQPKAEIPWEYEWLISTLHEEPFFIHDYPKGARGFYDREYPDKPGYLMDFDLIFPFGYGEAISGAAREYDVRKVIPRMKESGESLQKYQWYLEFLKRHGKPTAGFGIGLERTVRYFCGLPSIYMTLPYPRIPGMFTP
ncbi:MAG: asparagine ligase [Methanobacteriota archaeon]|nr:MAG: asparagine ligase [Euryarchaeota archaeon]